MKDRPPAPQGPYLVVGLARSGMAAARTLRERGETVIGVDSGKPPGAAQLAELGVELHTAARGQTVGASVQQPGRLGDGVGASVQQPGRLGDGVGGSVPEPGRLGDRVGGSVHEHERLLDRVGAIVKSPGVPAGAPLIVAARSRGMAVLGELELAWRLIPNQFIAVTGTNGKTTTVELIGHIHRQAGLPAVVAGNVGVALSGLVGAVEERVTIVCEVSSFQLEDTLAFAPEAAVLLNLAPDHLDRHESFERYVDAKLQIFARQDPSDLAVLPLGLLGERIGGRARRVRFGAEQQAELSQSDGALCWQGEPLIAVADIRLRGAHNVQNAMAAAAVCLARGVEREAVASALRDFPGVPHRLEEVASVGGVLYVNDSKATNVASTLVALDAMASDGLATHLILGGLGKAQDFAPLAAAVQRGCRAVYLIGEDARSIERALLGTDVPLTQCAELERALAQAHAAARPGEAVLLSPGCASFDQFADFEARGERFRELVAGIRRST